MLKTKEAEDIADELLLEWWHWSRQWKPKLGVPRISPACRESGSNRQWDNSSEISDEYERRTTMEAVKWCVESLPYEYDQAIGIEMRNREVNAKVWRPAVQVQCNITYEQAISRIIPKMKEKCLL
jgi:hypothetical protein